MIEEIKEGMYVRTINNGIQKVALHIKGNSLLKITPGILLERFLLPIRIDEVIGKPSNNIIDLIEAGDYVNGYKVSRSVDFDVEEEKFIQCDYTVNYGEVKDFHFRFYESSIKSIVTKEQFASVSYEVGR